MNDSQPLYKVNDKCYAPDTRGHIYLATIKKIDCSPSETQRYKLKYLVHFMGWNSRYDVWHTEDKLLPDTEETRSAAQQVQLQLKELKDRKKKKNLPPKQSKKNKKIKSEKVNGVIHRDSVEQKSPSYHERISKECHTLLDSCKLPVGLQNVLVQEYLYFSPLQGRQNNLNMADSKNRQHELPACIHVQRILHKFAKVSIREKKRVYCAKMDSSVVKKEISFMKQMYNDFVSDMCLLFDAALPKFFLYNFEREQYHRLLRPLENVPDEEPLEKETNHHDDVISGSSTVRENASMSQVYSGEYLLRMITRLPFILSSIKRDAANKEYSSMSILLKWKIAYRSQLNHLAKLISELVRFLDRYKSQMFKGKYLEGPTDE